MGYEGKRIKPGQGQGTWEFSRGRKVEKFWGEWFLTALIIISFLVLVAVALFAFFVPPPEVPPLQQKRELEPLIPPMFPPLLFGKPLPPPRPSRQQKPEKAIPIHWSHGGHHGHHDHYGHYYPYYSYPYSYSVRPWERYYSYPYDSYSCYGCEYGRWYYEERERRPYFELHRMPNGETQMRWGFQ